MCLHRRVDECSWPRSPGHKKESVVGSAWEVEFGEFQFHLETRGSQGHWRLWDDVFRAGLGGLSGGDPCWPPRVGDKERWRPVGFSGTMFRCRHVIQLVGLRETLQQSPMIFMGKSMVQKQWMQLCIYSVAQCIPRMCGNAKSSWSWAVKGVRGTDKCDINNVNTVVRKTQKIALNCGFWSCLSCYAKPWKTPNSVSRMVFWYVLLRTKCPSPSLHLEVCYRYLHIFPYFSIFPFIKWPISGAMPAGLQQLVRLWMAL